MNLLMDDAAGILAPTRVTRAIARLYQTPTGKRLFDQACETGVVIDNSFFEDHFFIPRPPCNLREDIERLATSLAEEIVACDPSQSSSFSDLGSPRGFRFLPLRKAGLTIVEALKPELDKIFGPRNLDKVGPPEIDGTCSGQTVLAPTTRLERFGNLLRLTFAN